MGVFAQFIFLQPLTEILILAVDTQFLVQLSRKMAS
jgi:hypothetical protein